MCERSVKRFRHGGGWLAVVLLLFAGGGTAIEDFGRDPTQPVPRPGTGVAAPDRPSPPPLADMIHTRDGERRAYIQGNWYRAGDRVADFEVEDISATRVTLTRGNRRYILSVSRRDYEVQER